MTELPETARSLHSAARAAWLSGSVLVLFGTIGWGLSDISFEMNCADHVGCGDLSCSPCATKFLWVLAGGIGQWVLFVAVVLMFVLGRRHPTWLQRTTFVTAALLPIAFIWFFATLEAASW